MISPEPQKNTLSRNTIFESPCGQGLEYNRRFLVCCMRQLKGCPDGSASTAWVYAGLLCNLYSQDWRDREPGPKRCHYFLNLLCPIPTQHLLHMVQHVAN